MSKLDRWPSTPVKLITAWAFSVIFFFAALWVMLRNWTINETVFFTLAGSVFGTDAIAAYQFFKKRETAWQPPNTPSEAGSTQVVDRAVAVAVKERVEATAPANPVIIASAPTVQPTTVTITPTTDPRDG